MMRQSIRTATREHRTYAKARHAAWISDEELIIALRAAGASAEDVERYLATDNMHSPAAQLKYPLPS